MLRGEQTHARSETSKGDKYRPQALRRSGPALTKNKKKDIAVRREEERGSNTNRSAGEGEIKVSSRSGGRKKGRRKARFWENQKSMR